MTRSVDDRLDALWEAWVQASPEVIPRLGMDWGNVTEIDSPAAAIRARETPVWLCPGSLQSVAQKTIRV